MTDEKQIQAEMMHLRTVMSEAFTCSSEAERKEMFELAIGIYEEQFARKRDGVNFLLFLDSMMFFAMKLIQTNEPRI